MFIENLYIYYPSPYQYNTRLLLKKIHVFKDYLESEWVYIFEKC